MGCDPLPGVSVCVCVCVWCVRCVDGPINQTTGCVMLSLVCVCVWVDGPINQNTGSVILSLGYLTVHPFNTLRTSMNVSLLSARWNIYFSYTLATKFYIWSALDVRLSMQKSDLSVRGHHTIDKDQMYLTNAFIVQSKKLWYIIYSPVFCGVYI